MIDFSLPSDNEEQKRIGENYSVEPEQEKKPVRKKNYTVIIVLILLIVGIISYLHYQNKVLNPKQTRTELLEIRNALFHYKKSFGTYPNHLTELVKGRPLREIWLTDAWDNPYRYEVDGTQQTFVVISAGSDGKFGTADDIQVKQ